MSSRVCICCGELRDALEYDPAQNPHICAACSGLMAEIEECSAPMHPLRQAAEAQEEISDAS